MKDTYKKKSQLIEELEELRKQIVELKKLEEVLQASNERLEYLLKSISVAVYTSRTSGDYGATSVTDNVKQMTGYEPREFIENSNFWIDHVHPEDKQRILNELPIIFKRGSHIYEYRFLHKDGSYRWMRDEMKLVRDEVGNPAEILGHWLDITERKQAEEALRESEERLHNILQGSPIPAFMIDKNHRILYWNRALEELSGIKAEEIIGTTYHWRAFYDSERPCMADLLVDEALEKIPLWYAGKFSKSKLIENAYEATDFFPALGEEGKWLRFTAAAIKNSHGNLIGAIETLEDITERRQIEEVLRESEVRLKSIFRAAPIGIGLVSNRVLLQVNDRICEMVGYSREELHGKNARIIYPTDEDYEYVGREKYAQIRDRGTGTVETRWKRKDGTVINVLLSSTPLDPDNLSAGVTFTALDITEHKKLEDQFRQAQKMEAVGQLAGGVAHDFNNILQTIIGYASLMKMKMDEDDPLRRNVEQILFSSERAAYLVQSLLAFSRKQLIDLKPMNLNEIIEKEEKLLVRLIGEDIELKTDLTDEELVVMADSGQIEHVLMNLATNARDAMSEGGVLSISTELVELDEKYLKTHGYGITGTYALISVTDTGKGMDEKTKEKIFEPFFTTKELGKGTGLGLSMVYGIVKQHNGYINAYSELGKGTTFKIYLPVVKAEVGKDKPAPGTIPVAVEGAETILIAEDSMEVRKFTRTVLEEFGYTVIEAVDGEDAIHKFMENKHTIQFLILDVIMPKKNGKEVYEEVRKVSPDMRALFISGYSENIIHRKGIVEEGLHFILKPVSPKELLRKVREVLDKSN